MVCGAPPDAAEIRRVAELHRAALPSSVLARMGVEMLGRYYRWVAGSSREVLFVARDGGRVEAAAVVSFERATVIRRFASDDPGAFVLTLLSTLLRDAAFRRDALAYARETLPGRRRDTEHPELVQIFVAESRRNQRLGTALVHRVERDLCRRGRHDYDVRTLHDDNDPALAFYLHRGFQPVGDLPFCGRRYTVLRKRLQAAGDPA